MIENKNELIVTEGEDTQENICFIITPIGGNNSDVRRHAEGVIEAVIKPVLESDEFNYKVIVAHEINETGSIPDQVFEQVVNAKLVIANVTGLNPNVMYELGVRHALRLPVVTIAEEGTLLPFDINTQRTIFYKNDMFGTSELRDNLINMIENIKFDEESTDNPVMNALRRSRLFKEVDSTDKEQQLLKEVYDLLKSMNANNMNKGSEHLKIIAIRIVKFAENMSLDDVEPNDANFIKDFISLLPYSLRIIKMQVNLKDINLKIQLKSSLDKAGLIELLNQEFMNSNFQYRVVIE